MLRVTGVDDLVEDECVGMDLLQGTGMPQVGGGGFLVADQTFERDAAITPTVLADLAVNDPASFEAVVAKAKAAIG
jgi:hypothetical protein